ncbi:hypothetical protein ABT336_00325 [Micromonospora sp. NPDC000207]|uniref:hypothetical protein n=1 Tax=Micromonospora sp. NPDC000207 TaxID=3154246 RepID=UPI003318E253
MARTRIRRILPNLLVEADPTACLCPTGQGIPVATFERERLVEVERRHLIATGCGRGSEQVPVAAFLAGIRIGRS